MKKYYHPDLTCRICGEFYKGKYILRPLDNCLGCLEEICGNCIIKLQLWK